MANLAAFGFADLMNLRARLRDVFAGNEPATFEGAAQRLAELFYHELTDDTGQAASALVRIYRTHRVADLPSDLQSWAEQLVAPRSLAPDVRCLTLVGTAGGQAEWNSRHHSRGHKAIPLLDTDAVAQIPMVAQLIRGLGLDFATVLRPDASMMLAADLRGNGTFHVPEAVGSPHIPAQEDFVLRHQIKSVIGFGGMMSSGDLLACIIFSRVLIPGAVADQFKIIGLNFQLAMIPFLHKPPFAANANSH